MEMKGANGKVAPSYFGSSKADFGTMENKQGLQLQHYSWPAELQNAQTKAVVMLVHGVSCHVMYEYLNHLTFPEGSNSGEFTGYEGANFHDPQYEGSWIEAFNKDGYTVVGMDQQSYGLSQGVGGMDYFFESFDDLVDDQVQFCEQVTEKYAGLPVFMLGVSLGGCVTTRVAERQTLAGYIMLAPMLSLETLKKKPINKVLLPFAGCASRLVPRLRIAQKEDHPAEGQHKHYCADPLNESALIRARVAGECLAVVENARNDIPKIKSPFLVLHALGDTMCDHEGSQFLYDNAGSEDKTIHLLENKHLFHVLNSEPSHLANLKICQEWMKLRVAPLRLEGDTLVAQ